MSGNENLIASLNYITAQINRYGALFVILFGTTGNLLNFIVFNDRAFHENPCTNYLWWSSISSILFIWSGLLTRVLSGYGINWPNQNPPLCKIRLFILNICWSIAAWAFVGATMDRYFCSSASAVYRLKSSIRTARKFLIAILILSILLFVQVFYCYQASVPNVPVLCYTQAPACQLYNDWTNILYNITIPSCFMAIFGILTITNIRKRIIHPAPTSNSLSMPNNANMHVNLKKIDRNLRRILLIQVLVLLALSLPVGIQRLYASVTSNVSKSSLQVAIENLIYAIIVLIRFIAYSMSFYLYIFSGSMFRDTFKRKIQRKLRDMHIIH
ncbi:unnamed protein product [Adineta steineri]|uniref:G-protein coupled receptors family 1 profile domain-containing protein n=1 Tax=Adineta steineri TaxID=433720 RepID=A0A815ZLE9_9BILA|nr:unnamed protein product [Adineta steineri]CAF1584783.1 unnamed protein product [Adineta steineri]